MQPGTRPLATNAPFHETRPRFSLGKQLPFLAATALVISIGLSLTLASENRNRRRLSSFFPRNRRCSSLKIEIVVCSNRRRSKLSLLESVSSSFLARNRRRSSLKIIVVRRSKSSPFYRSKWSPLGNRRRFAHASGTVSA
jgi:hypothetical protein